MYCERERESDRRITSRRREENESLFGGGEGSLTESRKRKGNLVILVGGCEGNLVILCEL